MKPCAPAVPAVLASNPVVTSYDQLTQNLLVAATDEAESNQQRQKPSSSARHLGDHRVRDMQSFANRLLKGAKTSTQQVKRNPERIKPGPIARARQIEATINQEKPMPSSFAPKLDRHRAKEMQRLENQSEKRARAHAEQVEHTRRLASRDLDEHFGANTDVRYIREMIMAQMQMTDTGHSTASGSSEPMSAVVLPATQMEVPFGWCGTDMEQSGSWNVLQTCHRFRDAEARAKQTEKEISALHQDRNAMPLVTNPASLTMNTVYDTMLLSIPKSRRRNLLQSSERRSQSLLGASGTHMHLASLSRRPRRFRWSHCTLTQRFRTCHRTISRWRLCTSCYRHQTVCLEPAAVPKRWNCHTSCRLLPDAAV